MQKNQSAERTRETENGALTTEKDADNNAVYILRCDVNRKRDGKREGPLILYFAFGLQNALDLTNLYGKHLQRVLRPFMRPSSSQRALFPALKRAVRAHKKFDKKMINCGEEGALRGSTGAMKGANN